MPFNPVADACVKGGGIENPRIHLSLDKVYSGPDRILFPIHGIFKTDRASGAGTTAAAKRRRACAYPGGCPAAKRQKAPGPKGPATGANEQAAKRRLDCYDESINLLACIGVPALPMLG